MGILRYRSFLIFILSLLLALSCIPENQTGNSGQQSTAETERVEPTDALDWSTVTPEDLWTAVGQLYSEEGPKYSLTLLDRAVEKGVVPLLDAEQVRAGFLFELGRYDEAFLSLAHYRIDTTRPDLLRLRAEVLWQMGRYGEAKRDYLALYDSGGENKTPEVIYSLAKLNESLAEWDNSAMYRDELSMLGENEPLAINLKFNDAILSEDSEQIRIVENQWAAIQGEGFTGDVVTALAGIYINYLDSNKGEAAQTARDYIDQKGFDDGVALMLLRINAESGNYEEFRSDLAHLFKKLDANQWLDAPEGTIPLPPDNPVAVAGLLDSASAFELGSGNRNRARLLANRALMLYPYDYVAYLQLAAVEMTAQNFPAAFEQLNKAVMYAPLSDIRTRLRMLQFSELTNDPASIQWDKDKITGELAELIDHWTQAYPRNAFFMSAKAELAGYQGDIDSAVRIYDDASVRAGASKEIRFRHAYFLARDNRNSEAIRAISAILPAGSPYLTWVAALIQEAEARTDPNLAEYAAMVRNHLDPRNEHAEFFAPLHEENSESE